MSSRALANPKKKRDPGWQRGFGVGVGGHSRWCQHQAQIWYPHLHGRKCLSVASNGLQQSGQSSPVSLSSSPADIVSLCVLPPSPSKNRSLAHAGALCPPATRRFESRSSLARFL